MCISLFCRKLYQQIAVETFIAGDPLGLHKATARFLFQSVRFDWYLKRTRQHIRVPILLQLAGRDQIVDNGRTRQFVGRFGSRHVRVVEYAKAQHTLEFEPSPQRFLDDLCSWIDTTSRFVAWKR